MSPQGLDQWCFDVFSLHRAAEEHSLRTVVFELFTRHNLNSRFKVCPGPQKPPKYPQIPPSTLNSCLKVCRSPKTPPNNPNSPFTSSTV